MSDLRVALPAVNRHEMKIDERARGLHVRLAEGDADVVQLQFFEPPGILAAEATVKAIERCYSRQEYRRVPTGEIGSIAYPTRATESYVQELLGALDREAIAGAGLRVALDYSYSPASIVMPAMIGDLGVEMVALNAFIEATAVARAADLSRALHATGQLVVAMGADVGIVMDNQAERVWLIDEHGHPIDAETTLLLLLRELAGSTDSGSAAGADHRDRTGGAGDGGGGGAGAPHQGLAAGAAGGGRRGRCGVRRRVREAATCSRPSCPPTTRSCRSARCWRWWPIPAARCRRWWPTCRQHPRAPVGELPMVAQGRDHAAADRGGQGDEVGQHGRHQGV